MGLTLMGGMSASRRDEEWSLMAKTFKAADGLVAVDLIHCGLDHVDAAQALFDGSASFYDSAGYLAHLGVELLIKGWLLKVAGQFERAHCLDKLYRSLVTQCDAPPLSDRAAKALKILDEYGELRYPNRHQPTEVGTDDWPHIDALICELLLSMPLSLREALEKEQSVYKSGRRLMEKRVEKHSD